MTRPMEKSRSGLLAWLVRYYGAVQVVHFMALLVESWHWTRSGVPAILAPPPAAGWSDQALYLLLGTGVADGIVVPFSVLFAWGWLRGKRWAGWLGALTLGASVFSAIIFGVGTVPTGVWAERVAYTIEAVLFAPIGLLFILYIRHLLASEPAQH